MAAHWDISYYSEHVISAPKNRQVTVTLVMNTVLCTWKFLTELAKF